MRVNTLEASRAVAQLRRHRPDNAPSISAKEQQRRELERDVEKYLQAGNQIRTAEDVPSFPWPLTDDVRQLVSVANFSFKYSLRKSEVMAAIRRRELTAWTYRGDLHRLNTKAVAWQRQMELGGVK